MFVTELKIVFILYFTIGNQNFPFTLAHFLSMQTHMPSIEYIWLKLMSTKLLFKVHTTSTYVIDEFGSKQVTIICSIDSKQKTTFSTSTIAHCQVERTTMARLIGIENRYFAPAEFRGRTQTV